jgi:hypothetical protein
VNGVSIVACCWEFPQNVLGIVNFAIHRAMGNICRIERVDGRFVVEIRGDGAVSLGIFVFHTKNDSAIVPVGIENREHEWGHSMQSRMFGPLYLLIVGVPSAFRVFYAAGFRIVTGRRWSGYYDGWPENAADRLGKVDRSLRPKA